MLYSYSLYTIYLLFYNDSTKACFSSSFFFYALQVLARGHLDTRFFKACRWISVHCPDRICFCCSCFVSAFAFVQLEFSAALASTRKQQVVPLPFLCRLVSFFLFYFPITAIPRRLYRKVSFVPRQNLCRTTIPSDLRTSYAFCSRFSFCRILGCLRDGC